MSTKNSTPWLVSTYCVVRRYHTKIPLKNLPLRARNRVVRKGLTIEQAQAHCLSPKASTDKYYDLYFPDEKCKHKKGYNSCE